MKKIYLLFAIAAVTAIAVFKGEDVYAMIKGRAKYIGKPSPFDDYIATYAGLYGVDPLLVMAIIQTESNWDPKAENPSDPSTGLMQITMPVAHDFFGHDIAWDALQDPETNIKVGTWLIAKLTKKYGLEGGTASYNFGPGNWLKGKKNEVYTSKVFAYYDQYKKG